jgi:hypothetical protein
MKTSLFTHAYLSRQTFRGFKRRFVLTYQQFFFLWYLYEHQFTDPFRCCDVQLPGCDVTNALYYLKTLRQKGYLQKDGKYYTLTALANSNFNEFITTYHKRISAPFSWG